jgi:hypothetical protein
VTTRTPIRRRVIRSILCWLSGGHRWGYPGWDRRSDIDPTGGAAVTTRACEECWTQRVTPSRMRDWLRRGIGRGEQPSWSVEPRFSGARSRPRCRCGAAPPVACWSVAGSGISGASAVSMSGAGATTGALTHDDPDSQDHRGRTRGGSPRHSHPAQGCSREPCPCGVVGQPGRGLHRCLWSDDACHGRLVAD